MLAGYLLALGGTSMGQGWRLAPHLATAHAGAPLPAPALVAERSGIGVVLTTLRATDREAPHGHRHSRATHTHETPEAHPRAARLAVAAPEARNTGEPEHTPAAPAVHEHDGVVHNHAPPPPRPTAPVVSLDKHQRPANPALPPPPSSAFASRSGGTRAGTRTLSVETPPPIRRG